MTEKKADVRVRYTKHIIEQEFVELLKEKSAYKITVKEVCERAQINRGTFYKHYLDIYDLLDQLENRAVESLVRDLFSGDQRGKDTLMDILKILREPQGLPAILVKQNDSTDFIQKLAGACSAKLTAGMHKGISEASMNDARMYYEYIVGGSGAILESYMKQEIDKSPEEVADAMIKLNDAVCHVLAIRSS